MFGRKRTSSSFASLHFRTLIGMSTTAEGALIFGDNVRIDGTVRGDLRMKSGCRCVIAIASDARVCGDVRGHRVLVAGTVEGNIHATERVELLASARVTGDIAYGSICIAHGAHVTGMLTEASASDEANETTEIVLRAARAAGETPPGA